MTQLRQDYPQFVQLQTEIIVVGPEDAETFRQYWQQEELPFLGLPDPQHTVMRLYGQEVKLFTLGRLPVQVLIDIAGRLRYVHYSSSMWDIPANAAILQRLR